MKPISIKGFDLTVEDYLEANRNGKIVRVGVHINGPQCNFKCPYCLNGQGTHVIDHLENVDNPATFEELQKWIFEAKTLGSRCIIVDGVWEPLMNKEGCFEIMEYINDLGMVPMVVTNGSIMTEKMAKKLYQINATVITKLNVPLVDINDKRYPAIIEIQKKLSGVSKYNVYERLKKSVYLLIDQGFAIARKNEKGNLVTRLGVQTVISPHNYDFIAEMVSQMRKLNIYIHAETIKPQGRAEDERKFWIEKSKIKELFEKVKDDDKKIGIDTGDITPPLASGCCLRHMGTFNITLSGDVIPCPSIELVLGNLRNTTFKDIIDNNPHLKILRNLRQEIRGDCKECELLKKYECYGGCRGYTYMSLMRQGYSVNDALTASDPYCWNVTNIL